MTGEYPIHTGLHHYVLDADQPFGLPLNRKLLPEHFRDVGYSTYLVGKWHLGSWKKAYTPLQRGFDHHFGYWGPMIDYWSKEYGSLKSPHIRGRDLRHDYEINYDNSTYATDMFTDAAVGYIQRHPRSHPLFLMVNHLAPHAALADGN